MLDSNLNLAVIGSGTMGEAIVRGLLRSGRLQPRQIFATDRRAEVANALRQAHEVRTGTDNEEACRQADVVLLAVKPHEVAAVVDNDSMRKLLTQPAECEIEYRTCSLLRLVLRVQVLNLSVGIEQRQLRKT